MRIFQYIFCASCIVCIQYISITCLNYFILCSALLYLFHFVRCYRQKQMHFLPNCIHPYIFFQFFLQIIQTLSVLSYVQPSSMTDVLGILFQLSLRVPVYSSFFLILFHSFSRYRLSTSFSIDSVFPTSLFNYLSPKILVGYCVCTRKTEMV